MVLDTRYFYDVASSKRITGLITSPQSPSPISHMYGKLIKFHGLGLLIKFQCERFVSSLEETYCFSVTYVNTAMQCDYENSRH